MDDVNPELSDEYLNEVNTRFGRTLTAKFLDSSTARYRLQKTADDVPALLGEIERLKASERQAYWAGFSEGWEEGYQHGKC